MFDHIITLSLNPAIDATLWVERIGKGEDNSVRYEKYESAGKAMNVSRALGIYGVQTQALVLAGAHNRERYEEPLKEEGIQYTIIPVEGYTRENISIVEENRTVTRFLREGFTVPYEAITQLLELLSQEVKERTLVLFRSIWRCSAPGLRSGSPEHGKVPCSRCSSHTRQSCQGSLSRR